MAGHDDELDCQDPGWDNLLEYVQRSQWFGRMLLSVLCLFFVSGLGWYRCVPNPPNGAVLLIENLVNGVLVPWLVMVLSCGCTVVVC